MREKMNFAFFKTEKQDDILIVTFNNTQKMNAMNLAFFEELPLLVEEIEKDDSVKVVIFRSDAKHFSVGLDVFDLGQKMPDLLKTETKAKRVKLYNLIKKMQLGMNMIEEGKKIYIAAVNGYCIGGALDLIAACDLRTASMDAKFSLRETKLAIIADLGSLQRLPFIIGSANTKYLAFTGKDITAKEAKEMHLINELYENKEELDKKTLELAKEIAENPFDAVSGAKKFINNLSEKIKKEELEKIATHNSAFLDFEEVAYYFQKSLQKKGVINE
ncbi:enoyl-CoA hydratase/isomerase family protein [Deferribacter desulfuricans SSM1]|uniref:Enoyl-CoA hydratase/isomerase family protein n=2 Tax=Deferribacter TaxID=53572 RepID=D3PB55_DEFDS|nr:enoyl-CoA hydratase/isomerase family protein [Deferribacter desulfuricans SSM1]